ncbi:hypothetical protein JW935_09390 [candidate division KSB1 bacterium]|nr:hypothetical protein [candidate division KSB1 bacterium]
MYTNELLEEKYKAQQKIAKEAKKQNMEYSVYIQSEVEKLFAEKGWKIKYAKRKGGFLKPPLDKESR